MENTNLFLISILHLLFGGTALIVTINGIVKCNKISVFDCIKLMYAMIYGFLQGYKAVRIFSKKHKGFAHC